MVSRNKLYLNVGKCKVFCAYRIPSPISFDYVLGSKILEKVTEINDRGVVFDRKLTFKSHIDYIVSKANINLGFVKYYAREFKIHYIYKILFKLEYSTRCALLGLQSLEYR